jgi:cytochrome c-type biogenesis protein
MGSPTSLAIDGPLLFAALIAVVAGLVSFASPCVLPLVPGYLAYLAGLVGADAPPVTESEARDAHAGSVSGGGVLTARRTGRLRVAAAAALFVAGFTVVFGVIMVGVVWLADALVRNEVLLQRVGGLVTS